MRHIRTLDPTTTTTNAATKFATSSGSALRYLFDRHACHNFYLGTLEAVRGRAEHEAATDTVTLEFAHELADAYLSAAVTGISSERAAASLGATSPGLTDAALRTATRRIHRAIVLFSWLYGPLSSFVMVRVFQETSSLAARRWWRRAATAMPATALFCIFLSTRRALALFFLWCLAPIVGSCARVRACV